MKLVVAFFRRLAHTTSIESERVTMKNENKNEKAESAETATLAEIRMWSRWRSYKNSGSYYNDGFDYAGDDAYDHDKVERAMSGGRRGRW